MNNNLWLTSPNSCHLFSLESHYKQALSPWSTAIFKVINYVYIVKSNCWFSFLIFLGRIEPANYSFLSNFFTWFSGCHTFWIPSCHSGGNIHSSWLLGRKERQDFSAWSQGHPWLQICLELNYSYFFFRKPPKIGEPIITEERILGNN